MRNVKTVLSILTLIFYVSNCSSPSSSAFYYTGDGESLMLQADELPPGWDLDYADNISELKNTRQWRKLYRVPASSIVSPQKLHQQPINSSVSIFENEADAINHWQSFNDLAEADSDETCLSMAADSGYQSDIADQYSIWCSAGDNLDGQEGYKQAIIVRYGNIVTFFSATVITDNVLSAEEAAELGVIRWQDAEQLAKLVDDKVHQVMSEQQNNK